MLQSINNLSISKLNSKINYSLIRLINMLIILNVSLILPKILFIFVLTIISMNILNLFMSGKFSNIFHIVFNNKVVIDFLNWDLPIIQYLYIKFKLDKFVFDDIMLLITFAIYPIFLLLFIIFDNSTLYILSVLIFIFLSLTYINNKSL